MNPWAPIPDVRFETRWKLGDPGAVYEFNVKLYSMGLGTISDVEWEHDVRVAYEEFERALRKKYPWLGPMYFTGRSGGWLAIEDPKGQMTKPRLLAISKAVQAAKAQFKKDMRAAWPRR
jgi:hypothetical protein